MTVLEALSRTTDYFFTKGIENARLNAELLLCHVQACRRMDLYLNFDKPLTQPEVDAYRECVRRRGLREPVHYIIGACDFCDSTVAVTPAVLIPRPETEVLVQTVINDHEKQEGKRVLDLCTGSGAIAISLKKALASFSMCASDSSGPALSVAKGNGEKNGTQVEWILSDLFSGLAGKMFDIIVSNPPYIRSDDLAGLMPEVRDFEPRIALNGGADGLDFYRKIFSQAGAYLNESGELYLETGDGQAGQVVAIAQDNGFSHVKTVKDLAGKERIVVARKR
ncbi:MAG: protein-(glutamine-N5) methyltransferase, release factor-specific [Candidatus Raymondbacteria bacterium RifOxyA12_full_50_37]|uniref:Release factor glutamine methyltransferase n=1 Tax=Candidatus Raymondbacteria bacterium RIFOXYD12_FULL_49_13 TaxID=1817890 RepID=A0A1F7FA97_UNCRA|nr:MAG: protein-(glutamine-N5) methyltransferase, release factor-specific [Candidatus Raymondbacteria bacterium RifOxyA12_full_50_37]OGJ92397.1 MAG: protein-(glutamine-N5) methyltransferase, release factor-specific [Candidatus Raymondbacteria bacterium RIFOXYA2_FULL_49_16]OGJ99378.1 MAG: protein-(glutamine-N5) methyltransferase, release factor-specific [Candidatus Raymondbacteria bacterium RIFOXYC2_FULL_50_21]OGK03080.1 MAG: protein-(glutamine-N5) methyltransferase, release factor-specific [Cand